MKQRLTKWKRALRAFCLLSSFLFASRRVADRRSIELGRVAPFRVEQGWTFLNTDRDLNKIKGFWVEYSSPFGDTASPVAVLTFLRITNLADEPESIRTYELAVQADRCQWMNLSPIPLKDVSVFYLGNGFKESRLVDISANALDSEIGKPIMPRQTIDGFLLFDAPVRCHIGSQNRVQYRFVFQSTDQRAFEFTFVSSGPANNQISVADSDRGSVDSQTASSGNTVDLSSAIKAIRFWTDPWPLPR